MSSFSWSSHKMFRLLWFLFSSSASSAAAVQWLLAVVDLAKIRLTQAELQRELWDGMSSSSSLVWSSVYVRVVVVIPFLSPTIRMLCLQFYFTCILSSHRHTYTYIDTHIHGLMHMHTQRERPVGIGPYSYLCFSLYVIPQHPPSAAAPHLKVVQSVVISVPSVLQ